MLADALMGLGVSPLLAARTATGGVGPLTGNVATGTSFTTGKSLVTAQFMSTWSGAASAVISLPTVGGDNGALLADDYIVNNSGTSTLQVASSSGVGISVGASN